MDEPKHAPPVLTWERGFVIIANGSGYIEDRLIELVRLLNNGWRIEPYIGFQKYDGGISVAIARPYPGVVPPAQVADLNPFIDRPLEAEKEKPSEFAGVVDVKDVTHGEVATWTAQGYTVHQIYQKNVILVKKVQPK